MKPKDAHGRLRLSRCSNACSRCWTCWRAIRTRCRSRPCPRLPGCIPSTAHRILNDLTLGRYVDRPEAGSYRLGMRHAGDGQPRQGASGRARRGPARDARPAQVHPSAGQPVRTPGRRDRLHRAHLLRALGHAGRSGGGRPCAAAPHVGGQALSGQRRQPARARLRHAHGPLWPHTQQPDRHRRAGARTGHGAPAWHCPR